MDEHCFLWSLNLGYAGLGIKKTRILNIFFKIFFSDPTESQLTITRPASSFVVSHKRPPSVRIGTKGGRAIPSRLAPLPSADRSKTPSVVSNYLCSMCRTGSRNDCYMFENLNIWAATCDFQRCGILTSVDSDKPVQPPFKLRNSKWCSISSLTFIEYFSNKQRLWSECAYAQADLRLCWLHIPHCWKSHVVAQLCLSFLLST